MFNPHLDRWSTTKDCIPDLGVPLFILIEHDVVDEQDVLVNQPFVRYASLHRYDREPRILYWKLLDFDPETEEEVLQQCFSVIAWRYAQSRLPPLSDPRWKPVSGREHDYDGIVERSQDPRLPEL